MSTSIEIPPLMGFTPTILPILIWPDELLTKQCEDVTEFNDELNKTIINLFTTVKANKGIGLAAPQVGILSNIIVINVDNYPPSIIINPKIIEIDATNTITMEEGCLSVPGYFTKRSRPSRIIVQYKNEVGEDKEAEYRGVFSFLIQHEIDHLHGKLFVDDLSSIKRTFAKRAVKKTINKNMQSQEAQLQLDNVTQ